MTESNFFDKAKNAAKKATETASESVQPFASKASDSVEELANSTGKLYLESGAKRQLDTLTTTAKKHYDESGLNDQAKAISDTVSDQFDIVSGQAMFQAIQDYMAKQDQYNDILANKLFEALERIRNIEESLDGK